MHFYVKSTSKIENEQLLKNDVFFVKDAES